MSSKGINKVILIGYAVDDPTVVQVNNQHASAFSLATDDSWNDKTTGQRPVKSELHRIVVEGRGFEETKGQVRQGAHIYLEGRLKTRVDQKQGVKLYITEVVVGSGGALQLLEADSQKHQKEQSHSPAAPHSKPPSKLNPPAPQSFDDFDTFDPGAI